MAEYTIPKPYRDFYVTNPAVETLERVQTLEKDALPNTEVKSGQSISGTNTLEGREIKVSVSNKNLIGYPYYSNSSTLEGATFTANEDGSIVCSGTPTGPANITLAKMKIDPSSTYVFRLDGTYENIALQYNLYDSSDNQLAFDGNKTEYTIDMSQYSGADNITILIKRLANNIPISGTCFPYFALVDGTETTVYATGKNLLNPVIGNVFTGTNVTSENGTFTLTTTKESERSYFEIYINNLNPSTTYTVSFDGTNHGTNGTVRGYLYDHKVIGYPSTSYTFMKSCSLDETSGKYIGTFTTGINQTSVVLVLYLLTGTYYENAKTTYSNIQLEKGSSMTDYESYHGQEITCQVGDTITFQQYEGYTCITADNMHVTLSGEFTEKIEDLLNKRPVILVGLFASRPTDTVNYPRIYVATDKTDTDRTTLLQANQSGATASNWIYI